MSVEISQENFHNWRHDVVTNEVFTFLIRKLDIIKNEMLDPSIITATNGQLKLCEMQGYRECLEDLIDIEFRDLHGETE